MSGAKILAATAAALICSLPLLASAQTDDSAGVVTTVNGDATLFRAAATQPVPVPTVLPQDPDPGDASRLPDGTRVLLVENNLEILRSLADLLRDSGCRVWTWY